MLGIYETAGGMKSLTGTPKNRSSETVQDSASLAVLFVVFRAGSQTPIEYPSLKDTCPLLRDTKREFPRSSMIRGVTLQTIGKSAARETPVYRPTLVVEPGKGAGFWSDLGQMVSGHPSFGRRPS